MAFLAGIIIASYLFVLLLFKKRKERADYLLLGWMALMVFHIFLFYLHYSEIAYDYPFTLGLILPLPVLHGVILYFYTCLLTGRPVKGPRLLHLVPFLILLLLAIPFYLLPAEEKITVYQNKGLGFEWYKLIQITTILISGFGYSIASIFSIHKHRKVMQENFSNTDRLMLRWLEYLAYGFGLIWCLALLFDDYVVFSGVVLFVLFIGLFGINQAPVFTNKVLVDNSNPDPGSSTKSPRYTKSGLKESDASFLFRKLEAMMAESRPYRNSDLSLQELAERLDVPPNQLSQVINSQAGKSFYNYINAKRLEGFLSLAAQPASKRYTFLALAHDCGFNSKTTFNKYFKLHTGKTPSEYFNQAGNQ